MNNEEKQYVINNIIKYNNSIDEEKKKIVQTKVLSALYSLTAGINLWLVGISGNKTTTILWCIACALNTLNAGLSAFKLSAYKQEKEELENEYNDYLDSLDANVDVEKQKHVLKIKVK